MTVLLLGATGFLGRHLADRLSRAMTVCAPRPRSGEVPPGLALAWLSTSVDAADPRTIDRVLDEARPDVVVNAIGLGAGAATDAELDAINGEFPRRLAAGAVAHRARVVHVSTDAVFSGARGAYRETDATDPADAYGRSKLAGELGAPHLTIRTSFFGRNPGGRGLIEWLASHRGPQVEGFADYRFTGVSVVLLADLVADAMAAGRSLEGVYHVGGDAITKYELLTAAARQLDLHVTVVPVMRGRVDRTLDASRFFAAIGRRRPTLADSLATLGSVRHPGPVGRCGTLSRS
ncbi:MAG: sugar nucleotide-binding protein [Acidobacteriia bacterium]|nr:sugar nucleotide-binding protein [Terriglobia bacterium]